MRNDIHLNPHSFRLLKNLKTSEHRSYSDMVISLCDLWLMVHGKAQISVNALIEARKQKILVLMGVDEDDELTKPLAVQ